MKVLVATSRTQGDRDSDFSGCIDGELVWIRPGGTDPSGHSLPCGCGRTFTGLGSQRHTTTAVVREIPGLTIAEYVLAHEAIPWLCAACAAYCARAQVELVSHLVPGTVVERDGVWMSVRVSV